MMLFLPLKKDIQTKEILKKSIKANSALSKLNGVAKIIPNQMILINALTLQEAKDSSEIENIITTHDELYLASVGESFTKEVKEVQNYKEALLFGYERVKQNKILTLNDIIKIQSIITQNCAGVRKQTGTVLKNDKTGEVIYTPPQNHDEIVRYLNNLFDYINDDSLEDYDYLVKMALIHYQFESIHPFYDGNGRSGRILNVLYLVLKDLLELPILYISSYIIKHKSDYYRLLREVREKNNYHEWIMYILGAIEITANNTCVLVENIEKLMSDTQEIIKQKLPKIYSKDLVEVLFLHPYTKIEFLVDRLNITRKTSSKYLKEIEKIGILKEVKIGRSRYFINIELFEYLKKAINE
jgi:Fic family protein